jgi:hypothetical protein
VLDSTHYAIAKAIWDEIDRTCGQRSPVPHPYPHFMYQSAERYDPRRLDEALRAVAAGSVPFRVTATGLAVFNHGTGTYVGVGRTSRLDRFHIALWDAVAHAALTAPHEERSTEQRAPHITLTLGPRMRAAIPDVVRLIYQRNPRWDIEINNLAVVYEDEIRKELISRHDFPHGSDPPPPLV